MTAAVLDRVRKLLALATSPNAHEAAAAAARAQALVDAHRLREWLEAERAVAEDPDPIDEGRDAPLEVARRIRPWKAALAAVLAEANGCAVYVLERGADQALVPIGRARDREVVAAMYAGLVKQVAWLSATHGAGRPRAWHEAFRVGVADALAERLAARGEAAADLPAEALVRVAPARAAHRAALEAFLERRFGPSRPRSRALDARAWRKGRELGADLPLRPTGDP